MQRFWLWLATAVLCIFGFCLFGGMENHRVMRNVDETFKRVAEGVPVNGREAETIRAVLDAQVDAWNRGDLEGFMKGYWKSEDLVFFSGGDVTKGWDAALARYRKRYQADGKEMGKVAFAEVEITPIGAENAIVRGRWKVVTSKETMEGLFTLRFQKLDAGWRIVHDHSSAAELPKKKE